MLDRWRDDLQFVLSLHGLIMIAATIWVACLAVRRALLWNVDERWPEALSTDHTGSEVRMDIIGHLASIVSALVAGGARMIPGLPARILKWILTGCAVFGITGVLRVILKASDCAEAARRRRPNAGGRSINGILKVGRITLFFVYTVPLFAVLTAIEF